ncbi:MAG TPA: PQQ-binding-like beta-propeller repeat protein, partial [Planctomycetota bacterium]|nr:PQQ-binding-like beta-propeller repeat protein [Planctomycetota bacterium]
MLALGLLVACLCQDPPDLGTRKDGIDWPGFLGPRHDGTSPEKGLALPWPSAGPRILWHRELGESYGACSILKGRLFQFDRQGDQMRLVCLRSETGEELWRYEYPSSYRDGYGAGNGPRSCPVADQDRVFVFDPAGILSCVRVQDGQLVWKKDTARDFGVVPNFFGVGSTPLVEGDLLLVMIGGSPP